MPQVEFGMWRFVPVLAAPACKQKQAAFSITPWSKSVMQFVPDMGQPALLPRDCAELCAHAAVL